MPAARDTSHLATASFARPPVAPPHSPRIVVHGGDARARKFYPAGSVELVVTSPPYPMVAQWDGLFAGLGARSYEEMHHELDRVWANCHRALVPGGLLAVVVGDALRSIDGEFQLWPNHVTVTDACRRLGFRALPYVLWKKPTNRPNAFLGSGFLPPNAYVTLDCEFILLFRKGRLRRFPRHDTARAKSAFTRAERDRWFSQVWADVRGARQGAPGRRSAAFPPAIPERLVRMFSVVGDTVLDPFAGTGTTLWAAYRAGRSAVGIELDPASAGRLAVEARQLTGPPEAIREARPRDG